MYRIKMEWKGEIDLRGMHCGKKLFVIFLCFAILLFIGVIAYYNFYYTYSEITEIRDWPVNYNEVYDMRSDEYIREVINLEAKDAVKIADHFFKDNTNRKYDVYYDKENDWYCVTAKYTGKRYSLKNRNSESIHKIIIDKGTGAILDIGIICY